MSNIDKQALRIPERKKHNWGQAVMRDCDFCQQWALTVRHSDGGCICASCCDSEYTTALSSALVVALDELEAAEKRIAEQQSAIIAPGIMRCAGCGFVLTKNSINMAAGTITAGDSKSEPCPNGCGPLWPVTWKEHSLQMRDDSERWFLEWQQAKNRIAELEARKVAVKQFDDFQIVHYGATEDYAKGYIDCQNNYNKALAAAGIGVKGE
ncbi:TPA: hypothetical protein ON529_002775 [Citrobacter freundii]|nr:hypothetical protein [Citrobacter freundii]